MKSVPSEIRLHRLFGCLAVLHAALLFLVLLILFRSVEEWTGWNRRLWVGFATLWFLWPLVLALHPAQSARRVLVPIGVAAPFVFFWFRWWSSIWGPPLFGLPEFIELTPSSMGWYAISYGIGCIDAEKDANAGRVILEAYGFGTFTPGAPNFPAEALNRCGIRINHVTGCVVNTRILGHAKGYNDIMLMEIKRRCGTAVVKAAQDEDARWLQSYDDGEKSGRADAASDLRAGRLAIEVSDPPKKGDVEFERMLRERYQIGFKRVDPEADPKMTNNVFGHATGYNQVAEAEIKRRFSKGTVEIIWKSFYENRPVD